jgi:hypothetical protein
MKTIIYYRNDQQYLGWEKFKSFRENYLEIKWWVANGNYIKINGILTNNLNTIFAYFKG